MERIVNHKIRLESFMKPVYSIGFYIVWLLFKIKERKKNAEITFKLLEMKI